MGRDRLLLVAFVLSGASALGYEVLWTRLLALGLGSETLGILGTLAGFFGGLALGSYLLHGRVVASAQPVRLFALFEAVAAGYALASPHLLAALGRRLPPLLGPAAGDNDSALALALSLAVATAVLLPATLPMGATLAALVEARRRRFPGDDGRGLGRLYGANTFGATAGVLAAVHLVLPRLGLAAGSLVFAALGLLAGGLALRWGRDDSRRPGPATPAPRPPRVEAGPALPERSLHALLLGTGLAGVGLEVVGVQVLAQPLEDTIYTFADILAVYLLGTAAGAWAYGRWAARPPAREREPRAVAAALLAAQVLSGLAAAWALRAAPGVLARLAPEGAGHGPRLAAEFLLAALVFLPPTLLMGALASHLLAQVAPRGVGRAYGWNTLGATLAPFVFGLGGIRLLGYAGAFLLAVLAYAVLAALAAGRRRAARAWTAAAALAAAAAALAPRSLALVAPEEGWRAVARRETLMGLVLVTERDAGASGGAALRRLQVNQHFRMGGGVAFGERRMGHIPLLLAPGARTALFLGTSTGGTLSAVRSFPLTRVEAVELVPEVLELMPLFAGINSEVWLDPRVRFHAADARRWVAASPGRFDVIVADLFHPARDGAGTLYSREHFLEVRRHLAPGGLFAQWLPLYQFDVANLKTVVRTFLAVFPEAHSLLGIYNAETPALALLGRVPQPGRERLQVDLERLERKLRDPIYRTLQMEDARDLFGAYMLDRPALVAYAGAGPLNTDLEPRVLFDAPRSAYETPPDLAWRSLEDLLPRRTPLPSSMVASREPLRMPGFRREAAAFARALSHYLRAEIARVAAGPGAEVPAAAREGYRRAHLAAPAFRPAEQALLALAAEE